MKDDVKHKYGDELVRLTQTIDESYQKIDSIPKVETDDFSTEKLKADVLPILNSAKSRIYDISMIIENLNSVRSEIINPVRGIVDQYYEVTKKSSVWGFAIGVLGILLSIITVLGINVDDIFKKKSTASYSYEFEPNNSPAKSSLLEADEVIGNISSPTDIDYFEVVSQGKGNLTITMIPPGTQDYELFLVDENAKIISESAYLPEHIEYLRYETTGKNIYIAVAPCGSALKDCRGSGSKNFKPGDYKLFVRLTEEPNKPIQPTPKNGAADG